MRHITGWRYETSLKLGIFRGMGDGVLCNLSKLYEFLPVPDNRGDYGKFWFTELGRNEIQPYIKALRQRGIKIRMKKIKVHAALNYEDEFQFDL